ncbi:MAG: aminotransferase class V-fold PLP-dependent enzyme, partial [Acinetobacter baumannii]|nr:aminotransferase class V-fold PLP-dependent enzyme [Acinetobacter baumannii]
MTTQLTTSNLQGSSTGPEVTGANPPANFPDESTIARLANEFFSAVPSSSSSTSSSGLNLDLPVGAPPHPPQPGEPFSALSGRAPNIAFQKSLNPEYPEHIPNLPDYPERRIVASAPVVGGANLPRPPFEPHLPQAAHSEPNVPRIEPNLPTGAGESPYYFLNDFSAPNATEPSVKGVEDNYSVAQSFQLPHGDQLKSLLTEDRFATNTPTQSSASSAFYFLDLPQSGQSYSHYQPSQPIFVASSAQPLDVHAIRRDFPILQERVNGRPLVWFDNAATTQKPQRVIDRIAYFYQHENSNIHRAAHELAARATDAYEHARNVVARFIGAPSSKEIIFVRGTTEG